MAEKRWVCQVKLVPEEGSLARYPDFSSALSLSAGGWEAFEQTTKTRYTIRFIGRALTLAEAADMGTRGNVPYDEKATFVESISARVSDGDGTVDARDP